MNPELAKQVKTTMKRCQIGMVHSDASNDLHADCYGLIGLLSTMVEELERGEYICHSCGLRKEAELSDTPEF